MVLANPIAAASRCFAAAAVIKDGHLAAAQTGRAAAAAAAAAASVNVQLLSCLAPADEQPANPSDWRSFRRYLYQACVYFCVLF